MRALAAGLGGTLLLAALGCPSAYQGAYQRELERLQSEAREQEAAEHAAHAEATRYAAVVYFEVGSAVIGEAGHRELAWFVERMRPYPEAVIEVRGFADATGAEARNQGLSEERAAAVARALGAQGIDATRILTQGFAEGFPAASNRTPEGRLNNRRVEVTVR